MMKKLYLFLAIGTLLYACKTDTKPAIDGYRVIGEAPGIYNGIRVYLNTVAANGRTVTKDTAIVMDEKFKFEGQLKSPEMVMLSVNSVKGSFPFILEQQEITFKINKEQIEQSEISGTEANTAMMDYNAKIDKIASELADTRKKFKLAKQKSPEKEALSYKIIESNKQRDDYPFEFLKTHDDNYFSLILVDKLIKERKKDIDRIAEGFNGLSKDLKTSTLGKEVQSKIDVTKLEMAALTATEIGQKAPNFKAPSTDGSTLELEEILGKVTIVDFWASWCGPCRRENPNVVRVYENYHDKGLEIISVSLDGSNRQKDPKSAWIKAIKDDNLNWHHVSNLNYFNDPVAKAYNIRSIPATYILDEDGKIIAKNLRGNDLENKIAQLLN